MKEITELTPAQIDFIKSVLPDFSLENWTVELAGRAASQRYFVRVTKESESFVLVVWDSRDEDWDRFITIQKNLKSAVPFLPQIYKYDTLHGLILEEDLGCITLKKYCIDNCNDKSSIETIYKKVLDALFEWQNIDVSLSKPITDRSMDFDTFMWETDYFARFCVTDYCACEYLLNEKWTNDRTDLARKASTIPQHCMHRDFQSENVMVHEGKIRFVDYQGARLGPSEYDTASLLFDPYVKQLTSDSIENLFKYYRMIAKNSDNEKSFYICAAQRLMQALGAYGNLSLHKGKEWYKTYIPLALERLVIVMKMLPEYKQIATVANACLDAVVRTDNRTV
jgi:aminoglycoside/choline kinase family phosphotransferase